MPVTYELTDQKKAIEAAEKEGFSIEYGSGNQLLLDIDDPVSLARYRRVLKVAQQRFKVKELERWDSKSGNTHIKLHLPKRMPETARIALQACLGSDPICELLRLERSLNDEEDAIVLFRPKVKEPEPVLTDDDIPF